MEQFRRKWIGDRAFYSYVLRLAVPMILQNAVTSFVSFLDNIMVGQIGTEQMSGVAIVNQLLFVFYLCIFGGVSGAGIFGTQYFGKGDYEGQRYAFRFKMYCCLAIGAVVLILFGVWNEPLISLYLSDAGSVGDVELALAYGKEYMIIMLWSIIPYIICQVYTNTIRETGQTVVPMAASFAALFVNLILDAILIFGLLGAPALGVAGAAIASVIARVVECLVVVVWAHTHIEKNPYLPGAYRSLRIPLKIMMPMVKKGLPVMVNEMLWGVGMAAIAQCYAVRGLEVVAAQNISSTINNLFNIVYMQLGFSISIVVGHLLGAGKKEEAKDADNKMIFFVIVLCVFIAALMVAVGRFFPYIYNTDESIRRLAQKFIVISALVMPFCAFSHCAYFTLRSGGKTLITFLFDSVFVWAVVLTTATGLAKHTMLPIVTVFFLVQFTEIFKNIIGAIMLKSNVWLQNIVDLKDS